MKIYAVGGAVRDELLGLKVTDRDYVVVGATPREMLRLGFKPVGKDFPVFLHPRSHEEYALARTERKTARGYKGFKIHAAPDVTLEDDLARRDLTINAIAKDENGRTIDPYGGVKDLKAGVLRHVSPAFAEDPVRILRVARFAARFGFQVAGETLELMRKMVQNGEVDALIAERVWQELAKGLMETKPSRMFEVLRQSGALSKILPEIDHLFGVPQPAEYHPEIDTGVHIMLVVDYAASKNFSLPVRFAALVHDLGKGVTPRSKWPHHPGHEARSEELVEKLCRRIRVPAGCRDLALLAARHHGEARRARELRPATVIRLLQALDAFRKPKRFVEFLEACSCDFHGRPGFETKPFAQAEILQQALHAAQSVNAGAIAKRLRNPALIAAKVRAARIAAVKDQLQQAVGTAAKLEAIKAL
ncbi:MAG TPA: multifunctional CCA addition/repair protein [Burkholderiales bacterium]|nr:multifunctional CCA addition/repair protein [Burkholderiales bacterium]